MSRRARAGPPGARSRLGSVATFKPAYLIHGDDHGRVGERRARLRAIAESESGAGGVEQLEADATPAIVAASLGALTFALGRRFVIVDGVERWKDADVTSELAPLLADPPPDTTVAFFAREDARAQAPKALHEAVLAAGGDVAAERLLKSRELPRWAMGEAERLGVRLDGSAAQALLARVGERQQRLLREIEKLAIEHGPAATIGVEEVEAAAPSAERQAWSLADAIVGGDREAAVSSYVRLRAQGEDPARLVPLVARRLRDVLAIAERLEAGESPADIKSGLRMSPYAADRRIKEARGSDAMALRAALESMAALELATRGGSELAADTEALLSVALG
jgi:DNA polymerase III subunit delta